MKKVSEEKGLRVCFRVGESTDNAIRRIANAEGKNISMVYRDMVEMGLEAAGYRKGGESMAELIRRNLDEILKPQADRLAAMSAKAAQISAANFFLMTWLADQQVPSYQKEELSSLVQESRKLGVEFLKLSRDKNLDEFIRRGYGRMTEDGGDDD